MSGPSALEAIRVLRTAELEMASVQVTGSMDAEERRVISAERAATLALVGIGHALLALVSASANGTEG